MREWKHMKPIATGLLSLGLAIFFAAAVGCTKLPPPTPLAQLDPQQMHGHDLFQVYCAQCHNARPGSQFSPPQWDAIAMHMRTQSNMPAKDMRAIKEFLETAR